MFVLDLWYKNAVIYCVDVRTFMDRDGDGIGDFSGLTDRLGHIDALGANCIWLTPFYPSPHRDNGYDVIDYYGVDPCVGTPGDFVTFTREARERGIRVIVDLVINHTSTDHPWFQAARRDPQSKYRSYYVWADEPPPGAELGVLFPGYQDSTWTYDEEAKQYYFHRFYHHQPDLNVMNPAVWEEFESIMGYWVELGVSGFRLDAAPFLIELQHLNAPPDTNPYRLLRHLRDFLQWRRGDAIMLAEANVSIEEVLEYFGDGNRVHMLFAFLMNQYTFLSLARQDAGPLRNILAALPPIPEMGQWASFLRNHDEIDLGRLSPEERNEVYTAFGPEDHMRLYGRGIRRRLAPMLNNDPKRIALAYAVLFSLPGTPVLYYGDEIGMGDNLDLPERDPVRTPMQWDTTPNGGFSTASPETLIRPVISGGDFGYERTNVTLQNRDPESLLNKIGRLVRTRRSTPEFGWGRYVVLDTKPSSVLAHRCEWRGNAMLTLHNLSDQPCNAELPADGQEATVLTDVLSDQEYPALPPGSRTIPLSGYGYRWLRIEAPKR